MLVELGADVDARDPHYGGTPLSAANFKDQRDVVEIIELLIAHGADVNARNKEGRTPVDQILQNGRADLADVLRRHGGHSA